MIAEVLVRLKPTVTDPVSLGVLQDIRALGLTEIESVISGKYFVLNLGSYNESMTRATIKEMCVKLLANQTIEQFTIWRLEATSEDEANILRDINALVAAHGLKAEYLGDRKTVGVQGDDRTYTLPIVLSGPFPGWEVLEELSSKISNTTPCNKVTYEITP